MRKGRHTVCEAESGYLDSLLHYGEEGPEEGKKRDSTTRCYFDTRLILRRASSSHARRRRRRRRRFLDAAAFSFKLHPRLLPVFFASSLSHPSVPTFSLFFFLNSERGGGTGGSGSAFSATLGSGGGGGIDRRRRRPELIQCRTDRLPFL